MRRLAPVLALIALSLAAPAAGAAVRTAVLVDARDGRVTAEGQASTPDLGRVEVVYDTAGRLELTADFFTDVSGLSTERAYAWSLRFALGRPSPVTPGACQPIVQGHVQIAAIPGIAIANRLAIIGTDGYLDLAPTLVHPPAVAGSRLAFSASSPALAGRNLRCIVVSVAAREHAPQEDETATYDEPCDCWYVGVTDDAVPMAWFPGLKPKPKTARPGAGPSAPRADGRHASSVRISVRAVSCGVVVGLRSVAPIDRPGAETARWGALVVSVRGPVRRAARASITGRSLARALATATIRGLRAGTYTVRAHYAGDARRQPSPPAIKVVSVRC